MRCSTTCRWWSARCGGSAPSSARLLDQWADQRGLPRPNGEPLCALHVAADRLQAEAPPHAMRLYGALDAAQHALDPTTYRSHYGLGRAVPVSSKRRQRRKACTGKVRYPAPGPATAAAERTTRGRYRLNAYHCPHCTGWHIGHPTRGQRHAARTATRERRHTT